MVVVFLDLHVLWRKDGSSARVSLVLDQFLESTYTPGNEKARTKVFLENDDDDLQGNEAEDSVDPCYRRRQLSLRES